MDEKFISLVAKGVICVITINLTYLLLFYKTKEYKYLWNLAKPIVDRLKSKLALN